MLIARKTKARLIMGYMTLFRDLLAAGLYFGLSGCLVIPEDKLYQSLKEREKSVRQVYKLYPGDVKSSSDLAIVEMGDVPLAKIDGLNVSATDYQVIHLLPGEHMLALRQTFGFSVMVEPSMMRKAETAITVELLSDHTYKLFADRTYGTGYKLYFWVEDTTDGKVIGGTKKP